MSIIYLFVDGIGLGKDDLDTNPFSRYADSFLKFLSGNAPTDATKDFICVSTDAHMGISGLPQSATGQTALWTGVNGPKLMGRHMTGFPGPTLVRAIHEHSIIKNFVESGKKASFLNAYTLTYFEKIIKNPRLASASTHTQLASGQAPLTMEDLASGKAIFMDITNEVLAQLYPELKEKYPIQDPFLRGQDLVEMSKDYDLVLFEYFLTDKAGHEQSFPFAGKTIKTIEAFVSGIISRMDTSKDLLIISSDHGNLEDLGTKSHTDNPVISFAWGKDAHKMPQRVRSLLDIPHFIYELSDMRETSERILSDRSNFSAVPG